MSAMPFFEKLQHSLEGAGESRGLCEYDIENQGRNRVSNIDGRSSGLPLLLVAKYNRHNWRRAACYHSWK